MVNSLHGGFYDSRRYFELDDELTAITPHSDVVIDMATTEYLDASSVSLLIRHLGVWRRQKPGTQLRLINVRPELAEAMRATKLDALFFIN